MIVKRKLINILVAIFYAIFYDFICRHFVEFYFHYAYNTDYTALSPNVYVEYVLCSIFPLLLYKGARNIASFLSIFVYILVYVPFVYTLFTHYNGTAYNYLIVFIISMLSFFVTDDVYMWKSIACGKKKMNYTKFKNISFVLLLIILLFNIPSVKFINFVDSSADLYESRSLIDYDIVTTYLLGWLKYVCLPIIAVVSLTNKHKVDLLLAVFGFIIIYMLDLLKMTLIMPFAIIGFFYLFHNTNITHFSNRFFIIISACIIAFSLILYSLSNTLVGFSLSALFSMRTVCIEGKQLDIYLDFFYNHHNPFSNYGHINIVNAIFDNYPYKQSLGYTVSYGKGNSNATFLLMDGMAALGEVGVLIATSCFIFVKSVLNSFSYFYKLPLLSVVLLFMVVNITNISLFTSLLTGGIIVLVIVLRFVDIPELYKNRKI